MTRQAKTAVLALVVMLLGPWLMRGQIRKQPSHTETRLPGTEERDRLLAVGKKLFMERCAKCHDERGDKALASGPPLNERDLSDEKIAGAVSGRFREKSDEEKRAVVLYIQSFMKRK